MSERALKRLVIGGAIAAVALVLTVYFAFDFVVKPPPASPPLTRERPGTRESEIEAAFTAAPLRDQPGDIHSFLDSFASTIRANRTAEACERFDLDGLYSLAKEIDLSPAERLPKYIGSQTPKLFPALTEAIGKGGFGLPWARIEVVSILPLAGGSERIVFARHIDNDHVVPVRWHLAMVGKSLKIKDLEDLQTGDRVSLWFALHLGISLSIPQKSEWQAAAAALRDARAAMARNNFPLAVASIGSATIPNWPSECQRIAMKNEGIIASYAGNRDRAESIAMSLGDDSAAHFIRMRVSKGYEQSAKDYEEKRGSCPATIEARILGRLVAGEIEVAIAICREAVIRFPESPLLQQWRLVLTP